MEPADADMTEITWYAIEIGGCLSDRWAEWFDGLTIVVGGGRTVLSGPITDQAALHGLLKKVRDLGMPLISVRALLDPENGAQTFERGVEQ